MNDVILILIAMLAVYGFYSALHEIRVLLLKVCRKKNSCAKKSSPPFDNEE